MQLSNNERKQILQTCINNIKHQSNLMKSNLNDNKLLQALKHCSNFLNELRSNNLTPKQYYEIYMLVFDSLGILSSYLIGGSNSKQSNSVFLADLYEIVQYSGNIIPRLYMMINIGTTYMAIEGAPTKDLMKDMIEMCHGVQHPIRGLFLRYYLSQRTKNLLPFDNESDLNDSVEFLISNFIEMNKLWVRLQHQGHSSERELRYKERKELKILVGSNLVRLSQIIDDYTDANEKFSSIDYYKDKVFPVITEQIIQCKDHLAQTYLIDVIIQIFPIEFQITTLKNLLNDVFLNLHPMLRKSELIETLVDKFINCSEESVVEEEEENELFNQFWSFYLNLNELDPTIPIEEHSNLLQSFINLSLSFKNSENFDNLNQIYKHASENLTSTSDSDEEMWFNLLILPINYFRSINTLFKLDNYYDFYQKIQNNKQLQKKISITIIDKLLEIGEPLKDISEIDAIFRYLLVLIKESPSKLDTAKNLGITKTIKINNDEKLITVEFLEIQEKICKIIQLIESDQDDPSKTISNLSYIRKKYLNKSLENIIYTYPTLITKYLYKSKILGYYKPHDTNLLVSNFKNLSIIVDEFYSNHEEFSSSTILKIYLNIANVADQLKLNSISYEIYNQVFVIYEENLKHSKKKGFINPHDSLSGGSIAYESIILIINSLIKTRHLLKNQYEELITKVTLHGSKLLKKQDQCRAVYLCSNLWWWNEILLPNGEKPTTMIEEEKPKEDEKPKMENTNQKEEGESKNEEKENNEEEQDDHKDEEKEKDVDEQEEEEILLYRDGKRVLECLQKSLRIADSCMDPYLSLKLFIEILNKCLISSIYGNDLIDYKYLNGLIDLIKTNIDNLQDQQNEDDEEVENGNDNDEENEIKETVLLKQAIGYFNKTLYYIKEQKELEGRFQNVNIH
ncbi:unnamed protein product [Candida verbasci]|uniref:Vacuolar protein sorting-associated protein 35 n=1 Tax=Candida verbasci TaxID=1227364 RepID=A0A9W4X8W1_9ASCO|nr:unnamed protein product [Candida verbasci]